MCVKNTQDKLFHFQCLGIQTFITLMIFFFNKFYYLCLREADLNYRICL